jgi:tRNA/rRNA methyltransferase
MASLLDDVQVVLLRPRWAANLGAVARAMKNFGLRRLALVDARIGSWADAWRLAVQAGDVLAAATTHDALAPALAGARWVVATSDRPPAGARVLTPRQVAQQAREYGPPTLVFGGEQNGLFPAELLRAHAVSSIPVAGEQSSLNLAQAACVHFAELFAEHGAAPAAAPVRSPASAAMMQRLELALTELLADSAFHDASRGRHAIAALLQPLWRAALDDTEVRRWLVALGKARQAPRRAPPQG